MVRIRLSRAGAKKSPFYRIVVTDHRSPRGGRFLETIGTFDPLRVAPGSATGAANGIVAIKNDRLEYWKAQGASVSDTLVAVLRKNATALAAAPAEAASPGRPARGAKSVGA